MVTERTILERTFESVVHAVMITNEPEKQLRLKMICHLVHNLILFSKQLEREQENTEGYRLTNETYLKIKRDLITQINEI